MLYTQIKGRCSAKSTFLLSKRGQWVIAIYVCLALLIVWGLLSAFLPWAFRSNSGYKFVSQSIALLGREGLEDVPTMPAIARPKSQQPKANRESEQEAFSLSHRNRVRTNLSPKEVLSRFFYAMDNHRYEEAFQYISAKDKAVMSFDEYLAENTLSEDSERFLNDFPLDGMLLNTRRKAEIKLVTTIGDRATATVEMTMANHELINKEVSQAISNEALKSVIMGRTRSNSEETDESLKDISRRLAEKYRREGIPMKVVTATYKLVKERGGWKVFLNWGAVFKQSEDLIYLLDKVKSAYSHDPP